MMRSWRIAPWWKGEAAQALSAVKKVIRKNERLRGEERRGIYMPAQLGRLL
jgi:hypothetical protein